MHDHSDRESPARPSRRRRLHLAVLVGAALALTLGVAACAGGGGKANGVASLSGSNKPTATTSANSSKDFKQAALEFARCMRQHGIDMPDPKFAADGRVTQELRSGPGRMGPDDPKFKAAQQACQKYMPNGGQLKKPNPQQQQQMLAFARCMRQHGIDVPDPGASGGIEIKNVRPDDPKFKAAQQACQKLLPNAGKGQGGLSTSGGGK